MCPSIAGIWTSPLTPCHCSCMQWAAVSTHGQWWWPATKIKTILLEATGRLIFKFIFLSFLSPLWSRVSSILTCHFFPLVSFQAAYYSRRDCHIPDSYFGNAVSPQLEVPCLDTERHSGECLFTRIHPSLADTDARGILHFQWHLLWIRAVCFQ